MALIREVWQGQLDAVRDILARHYPDGPTCSCLRSRPCPVVERLGDYAAHYVERIDHYDRLMASVNGPTLMLETLT